MDDYYSLMGVEPDAPVDDIRAAYRDKKAAIVGATDADKVNAKKLNKAWNVLSDPYQRGRYDEQRSQAVESGDLGRVRRCRRDAEHQRSPARAPASRGSPTA